MESCVTTTEKRPDQANRAAVTHPRTSPKDVDWYVFHGSVSRMSNDFYFATSAKATGVT